MSRSLSETVASLMPRLKDDLARLVAIPSVSEWGFPEHLTAWSWGAGIARFITPTSAVVMAGIALAGVRYDRWIRFMLPLMGILAVAAIAMLAAAALLE